MVTEEVLREQFQFLGCNVESEEALKKCIELCHEFGKDEEQIVEMWVAFSISKFGNIDLTLDGIQQLERAERIKPREEKSTSNPVINESTLSADVYPHSVVNDSTLSSNVDNDEILQMYGYKTPVTPIQSKRQRSPDFGSSGPENKVFAVESLSPKCSQVVIVPSYRDAHHEPVYPTPEFNLPKSLQSLNLHSMPDPCVLDIDGLTIGITAVDILKHLGNEELSSNSIKISKLHRVANHILSQACFYPLCPPAEEVNIDIDLWRNHAFMKQQPHILILPSDMGNFCKPINGCVVVNPQRLCKHSFARMHIKSTKEQTWDQNLVTCEILKV